MKKLFNILLAGVIVAASALSASAGYYIYDSSDEEYWDAALGMADKEGTVYWWTEDGGAADWSVAVDSNSVEYDGTKIADNLASGWYEVVFCGVGTTEDEFPEEVNGKIAFALRGDSTFTVKSENASNAGAIGLVVGNNCRPEEFVDENGVVTAGQYQVSNMSVEYETLPMCMVSSDLSVKLVSEMTGKSMADTVTAVSALAAGTATTIDFVGTQSAWLFLGSYEEYVANATRTDANTITTADASVADTAAEETVAEEPAAEETVAETEAETVAETEAETVEETEAVEEPAVETEPETVAEPVAETTAPQTFDFGVVAAVAAAVSAAGYALTKKR